MLSNIVTLKILVNRKREFFNRSRKQVKKMKLLEEVQRALFVAQIQDDTEALNWIEKILILSPLHP